MGEAVNYLDKIWEFKRHELESLMRRHPLVDVKAATRDVEGPRSFYKALTAGMAAEARIIAEVKKASPSRGIIVDNFDPVAIASTYEEHGARAVSVLTDEHFFQGQLGFIGLIKQSIGLPLLRKDFTLHEYQIYESRAAGADAVLLIARMLSTTQLMEYRHMASEMGMTSLLEIHDEADLKKSQIDRNLQQDDVLIGINNRDLASFKTDLATSEHLMKDIPGDVAVVAESGIRTREDIERLQRVGIHIFLVGESLLQSRDIGLKLDELIGLGNG